MRSRWPLLLAALAVAAISTPAPAQQGTAPTEAARQAIVAVINAQLAAFQRDDGAGAFAYASPTIRRKFGTAETFMAMVRSGYHAVYRPAGVAFLETRVEGDLTLQLVRLLGPDGRSVVAAYEMQRQPDGSWRINGVYLLELDETVS
jgi:hypothetical protein